METVALLLASLTFSLTLFSLPPSFILRAVSFSRVVNVTAWQTYEKLELVGSRIATVQAYPRSRCSLFRQHFPPHRAFSVLIYERRVRSSSNKKIKIIIKKILINNETYFSVFHALRNAILDPSSYRISFPYNYKLLTEFLVSGTPEALGSIVPSYTSGDVSSYNYLSFFSLLINIQVSKTILLLSQLKFCMQISSLFMLAVYPGNIILLGWITKITSYTKLLLTLFSQTPSSKVLPLGWETAFKICKQLQTHFAFS